LLGNIQKALVYAIIPARSGSKGVQGKNIREFAGHPLIAHSIVIAKAAPSISRVIVSTDSPKYAEIAERYGAEAPFLRPTEIAGDAALDVSFLMHAIDWLHDNGDVLPEHWVHLRPTSPVRTIGSIERALELMRNNPSANCLRSAARTSQTPNKWLVLDETQTFFKPLVKGMLMADTNNPRQSFPAVYIPDGNVDVLKTEFIVCNEAIHGERTLALITDEPIDIDTDTEWQEVEQWASLFESNTLLAGAEPA
jgi:CMP-N-acetylneuraminic acid synthetase